MRVYIIVGAITAVLFSSAALAGDTDRGANDTDKAPTMQQALAYFSEQDCPLGGVAEMEKMVHLGKLPPQTMSQFYAVTGDEPGASALFDVGAVSNTMPVVDTVGYHEHPAIAAIVAAARDRRIVLINEDHHSTRQRAFSLLLARALRGAGFNYFGAETFAPKLADSMRDGAPDLATGIYTVEPLYADLARQAAAMGFTLFDYEQRQNQEPPTGADSKQRTASREQAQADNIARVLADNPHARMLIHVGSGHGSEIPAGDGIAWMALRLKRAIGLDPLSIDQVWGTPRSSAAFDGPLYRGAMSSYRGTEPIVLTDHDGHWLSRRGFDMTVFHPRVSDISGRPGWLAMDGYRRPFEIKLKAQSVRTLLRAFKKDEPVGSIAMDQVLVPSDADSATLMLPTGRYRIVRQNERCESLPVEVSVIEQASSESDATHQSKRKGH